MKDIIKRLEMLKRTGKPIEALYDKGSIYPPVMEARHALAVYLLDMIDAGHSTELSVLEHEIVWALIALETEAARLRSMITRPK